VPECHTDLFGRIASFSALRTAAMKAALGKRGTPGAASFLANLETNLLRIERALLEGRWQSGGYTEIELHEPKRRIVSAAPFRDRVVHHALCAVVAPIFERGFIDDTYANRKGYGTHRAIARYEQFRNRYRHVLRADIYRYFPAIDHAILKADLRRRIACPQTLWLLDAIIDGSNAQEPVDLLFPGDDLLAPLTRRRGLPIGNLTSQLFGNVYLDALDHFAKEVLRAPYLRYVDDFALFHDDPLVLAGWRERLAAFLAHRRLKLHPVRPLLCRPRCPPSSSDWCCCLAAMQTTRFAACRKATCTASAIGCAACVIAGAPGRWSLMKWCNTFRRGLPTLNMRIPGACAIPSFAAGGSMYRTARRGSLTARLMGAGCAVVPGTTTPGTPAPPIATTTRPTTGTTTSVSV
jgi:retron-type reverse transcriptase